MARVGNKILSIQQETLKNYLTELNQGASGPASLALSLGRIDDKFKLFLTENEKRFQKALESIGDNVWEHDFTSGITYFSKSENFFLGYATDELSLNHKLWRESIHKDDLPLILESEARIKKGKTDKHNLEYRIILQG